MKILHTALKSSKLLIDTTNYQAGGSKIGRSISTKANLILISSLKF